MKRILALLLSFSLLGMLCGCGAVPAESPEDSDPTTSEASEATSETVSETVSETSDETSGGGGDVKTWPYVTGTFIQLPAFTSYTEVMWKKHFNYLLGVGIDTVILQWCATTPYGKFSDAFYPASPEASDQSDSYKEYKAVIPRILKVAQEMGVKVF
ncbi:MAG TPA: DUF4434 domain-containing protein, partial [Bacillota bacterium]|nr:DUF4434 domain-containing protein [Bacillota bacterium]